MKLSCRLLLLPAMISLLSACGEESSSLANPVANDSETTTTCVNKDYCLTGQFIDEPVVGLNYRCNSVEGVTDEEGAFSCPSNSVVTFYLQSEVAKHKITLGQYRMRSLGDVSDTPLKVVLSVTPKDIVPNAPEDYPNLLLTEGDTQVTNILRLLQALDSDGHSTNNAVNRIVIDSKDKKAIDELTKDITLTDFADKQNFDTVLKPMFDKLGTKSLASVTDQQAINRFKASLASIHSGAYEVLPTSVNKLNYDGKVSYSGMLGKWDSTDLHSMVSMFFLVDRQGKTIGDALEWQKSLTAAQLDNAILVRDILLAVAPTALDFVGNDMGFDYAGRVNSNFVLKGATGSVKLTQGTLLKGAIASSERFYRTIYGLTETDDVDASKLGKWQRLATDNSPQLTANFNLQKNRTVNLFLDPSIWRTVDNIAVGEKPVFPLHLKMTFKDGDRSTACGGTSGNGCSFGEVGITILDNGNIITDRDNDCSAVDAQTLIDQGDGGSNQAVAEQRLGVISTVLRDDTTKKALPLISPLILVGSWARTLPSDDPWFKFYGMYMGMPSGFTGGTKVQIDVSRALDKIVTIQHQTDEQAKSGVLPLWTNYVKFMQYFSMNEADRSQAEPFLQGRVTNIQTQTCYNPQPKI